MSAARNAAFFSLSRILICILAQWMFGTLSTSVVDASANSMCRGAFDTRCPCGEKYNEEHDKDSSKPKCIKGDNKHNCPCNEGPASGKCTKEDYCDASPAAGGKCDGETCKKTE